MIPLAPSGFWRVVLIQDCSTRREAKIVERTVELACV